MNEISKDLDPPDDGRIIEEKEDDKLVTLWEEEKIMWDIEMNSIALIGDAVVVDHCLDRCNGNGVC